MAAPSLHIKTGASTWKNVDGLYIKTGASTWKTVNNAYVKTGSTTWKKFFAAFAVNLSGTSGPLGAKYDTTSWIVGTAQAGWVFGSDGDLTKKTGSPWTASPHEWGSPEGTPPPSTYYIKFSADAGDAPASPSLPTGWLALTSDRSVTWQSTGSEVDGSVKVEIATDAGGSNIVATGYYGGRITTV